MTSAGRMAALPSVPPQSFKPPGFLLKPWAQITSSPTISSTTFQGDGELVLGAKLAITLLPPPSRTTWSSRTPMEEYILNTAGVISLVSRKKLYLKHAAWGESASK